MVQLGDRVAIFGRVAERLPADAGRIEIMEAEQLETAQDVTDLLEILGRFLWLVPACARRARDLARGRPAAVDRPDARHRSDRRRHPGPRRAQRRRQLRRRQPRPGRVGAAGRERCLGDPDRAPPRRRPDARRRRARAADRRLARRPWGEGDGGPQAAGTLARASGDRLRRRGARAGAARLVGPDGADAPVAGRAPVRGDARTRRRRTDQGREGGRRRRKATADG